MKPYQALIWNEWRQIRGSVMVLAGVTVLLWLMMLAACLDKTFVSYVEMSAIALAIGLPLLYSIVLADSFAREFSQKTDSFLLEMPVSPTKIFFCKYLANLAAFLVLVILEAQLMLRLGSRLTNEFQRGDSMIVLMSVAAIWVLAHAMVFMTSLLGRKSGSGIVAIIILPLPVILLLPGTMAATMFFINDDLTWAASFLLFTPIILYGVAIGLGWYLWTRRISRGLKIFKPVAMAFCILFMLPWVLYGMAYLYTTLRLNAVIREAKKSGMKQVFEPPSPASTTSHIVAAAINKFGSEYYKHKSPGMHFFNKCIWSGEITGDHAELTQTADMILSSPEMHGFSEIMDNMQKSADFHFMPYYNLNPTQIDLNKYFDLEWTILNYDNLLSRKAVALQIKGDEKAFFECLGKFDTLIAALGEDSAGFLKSRNISILEKKFRLAAYFGPDTPEAVQYYNEYIKDINAIDCFCAVSPLLILDYFRNSDFTPIGMLLQGTVYETSPNTLLRFLYLPRLQQSLAAWLKSEIREKELIERARQVSSFQEIKTDADQFDRLTSDIPGLLKYIYKFSFLYDTKILQSFYHKSSLEEFKIHLALKIYRAKHGRFPDSLQQLVPEILPKVPVNPNTGKNFGYQAKTDGFIFFRNPNDSRSKVEYHSSKFMEKAK